MSLTKIFAKADNEISIKDLNTAIEQGKTEQAIEFIKKLVTTSDCEYIDDSKNKLNGNDNGKATPIECAIRKNNSVVLDALLDWGASANVNTCYLNMKPLEYALETGAFTMAEKITKHADLKTTSSIDGSSMLEKALKRTSFLPIEGDPVEKHIRWELVKAIVENGADVNQKNKSGETPLTQITSFKSDENYLVNIAKLLIQGGAKITDEEISSAKQNKKSVLAELMVYAIEIGTTNSPKKATAPKMS